MRRPRPATGDQGADCDPRATGGATCPEPRPAVLKAWIFFLTSSMQGEHSLRPSVSPYVSRMTVREQAQHTILRQFVHLTFLCRAGAASPPSSSSKRQLQMGHATADSGIVTSTPSTRYLTKNVRKKTQPTNVAYFAAPALRLPERPTLDTWGEAGSFCSFDSDPLSSFFPGDPTGEALGLSLATTAATANAGTVPTVCGGGNIALSSGGGGRSEGTSAKTAAGGGGRSAGTSAPASAPSAIFQFENRSFTFSTRFHLAVMAWMRSRSSCGSCLEMSKK